MPSYAGIGSRKTPPEMLEWMERLAGALGGMGYTLRSGAAPGADQAFEKGARDNSHPHEIYLPWPSFEGGRDDAALSRPSAEALEIAARFHPGWNYLGPGARKLHARNVHQVLGKQLDDPAEFVFCWTPDGSVDGQGRKSGGTGQALRIATHYEVSVVNFAREEHLTKCASIIGIQGLLDEL